jgi:hypothetical protein
MNKATKILGAWGAVLILSGCPIWIETETVDPWACPDCGYYTCVTDAECPGGHYCHAGYCEPSTYCDARGACPPGFACNEWDTCVPAEHRPCQTNDHCLNGYCERPDENQLGWCVVTGTCSTENDCAAYGAGLTCDERNVCVPDEGPCPTGQCGCTSDSDCGDNSLCIDSLCTNTNVICVFDFECGDGVCLNNECHQNCDGNGDCPTGQDCQDGKCMDKPEGAGDCVFNEDCGNGSLRCLNATCHVACENDDICGEGEACLRGVCQANVRPQRQCADNSDCEGDKECKRGVCRMPCRSDLNCAGEDGMTVCAMDLCRYPAELEYTCQRASDCAGSNASCLNGLCVTLGQ